MLPDPIDSFWVMSGVSFDGKPFKSVTQGAADLALIPLLDVQEAPAPELEDAVKKFLVFMQGTLGDAVAQVRASDRLTDSAVCLVAGLQATQPAWIVLWFALAVGAIGMCEGPFWTTTIELGGRWGGTSAAICNTGGNAGGLIAPIITPFLSAWIVRHYDVSEKAGWQWAISLGCVIAVLGAVLWFWITPDEEFRASQSR